MIRKNMERSSKLVRDKFGQTLIATLGMAGSIAIASIVDRIMVGNFLGSRALAALSLNSPVICAINIIFDLFVFGGNTLAVNLKAKRDKKGANKSFTAAIVLGTIVVAVAALVCFIFRAPLSAALCRNKAELLGPVMDYLVPLLVLGILVLPVNGTCAFVRVDGLQKIAILVPAVANVVNLLFDFIFMKIFRLGIASAGWATNIGYAVGALCLIPYLRSDKRSFFFDREGLTDAAMIVETMKTGLSSALVDACQLIQAAAMNFFIIAAFDVIGAQVGAVCLSALSVSGIFFMGTTQTMLPIGSALHGEKDHTGLRSVMKTGFFMTEGFMIVIVAALEILARPFGSLFGVTSPEAVSLLDKAFRLYLLCLPLIGAQECLRVTLQATGRGTAASVLTGVSGTLCFVPVIWLCSRFAPMLIWLSFGIAALLAILGCLVILTLKAKKAGTKGGILFPVEDTDAKTFEFTIRNTISQAEEASETMIGLCRENGLEEKEANILGIAVEEMCTNIAKYAYPGRENAVDIFLRIEAPALVLRIRDNGVLFNPTTFVDERGIEVTGLKVLKKLPLQAEYNRVLGFNNTIITIGRTAK